MPRNSNSLSRSPLLTSFILQSELSTCLPIFLDRLKNEITRLTTVKALTKIAASPLKIDLRPIMVGGKIASGYFFVVRLNAIIVTFVCPFLFVARSHSYFRFFFEEESKSVETEYSHIARYVD